MGFCSMCLVHPLIANGASDSRRHPIHGTSLRKCDVAGRSDHVGKSSGARLALGRVRQATAGLARDARFASRLRLAGPGRSIPDLVGLAVRRRFGRRSSLSQGRACDCAQHRGGEECRQHHVHGRSPLTDARPALSRGEEWDRPRLTKFRRSPRVPSV